MRLQQIFRLVLLALAASAAAAHAQQPTIEYYHVDALGSVRAITDQSGAVVRTNNYHPFGEGVGVGAGADPMRFTGKPRDLETGLDYFGARYYAQRTGRFTSVDPFLESELATVEPQRWNRYVYALNTPAVYDDPDGRNPRLIQRLLQTPVAQRLLGSPTVRPIVRTGERLSSRLLDITSRLIPPPPSVPGEAGRVVIGSFPRYKELGAEIGARTFQVPKEIWDRMTDAQRWEANQKFLDRAINRGDSFITTDKISRLLIEGGKWTKQEIEYLLSKGYVPGPDGASLIPKK